VRPLLGEQLEVERKYDFVIPKRVLRYFTVGKGSENKNEKKLEKRVDLKSEILYSIKSWNSGIEVRHQRAVPQMQSKRPRKRGGLAPPSGFGMRGSDPSSNGR
jgi:hypothetical protein